jgi:hypothetical protein
MLFFSFLRLLFHFLDIGGGRARGGAALSQTPTAVDKVKINGIDGYSCPLRPVLPLASKARRAARRQSAHSWSLVNRTSNTVYHNVKATAWQPPVGLCAGASDALFKHFAARWPQQSMSSTIGVSPVEANYPLVITVCLSLLGTTVLTWCFGTISLLSDPLTC